MRSASFHGQERKARLTDPQLAGPSTRRYFMTAKRTASKPHDPRKRIRSPWFGRLFLRV